jgi:non-heme chloroperoxidase
MVGDFAADVASIPVPTLVLHGASDPTAPVQFTGEPTAALAPDAQLVVYDVAGHGIPLTIPDRIAADIVAFIGAGGDPSGTDEFRAGRRSWPTCASSS